MRAALILSAALLAAAAEDRSVASLRGRRSLSEVPENATAASMMAANESLTAGAGAVAEPPLEEELAETGWDPTTEVANASSLVAADWADLVAAAEKLSGGNVSGEAVEALLLMSGGWHQGGDKMWGSGAGLESISSGNVGYYNAGMYAAHARCGGAGCALMVNPPGHRTVNQFHIHFVHYHGYGASLKRRLESKVCGGHGWRGGGLPCGGRAAYFPGFPAVFSKAMAGGGLHHASVIAWPGACGGRGTIVELAYGCSIEHQIRGDYNPRYR